MTETLIQNPLSQAEAYKKKMPEPTPVYVVDFFSGCGGMSWGFANTRQSHMAYQVLGGIDIEEPALATYARNVGVAGVLQDIRNIAHRPEVLTELIPNFDPVTCRPLVFIGCAPCQGFSAHRKKDVRDDPRNNLMAAFARICAHFRPDVVVMENVPEIITGKYSSYWREASTVLTETGYHLSADVLDLSMYGVPQRRKRAVIMGALDRPIGLPKPIFSADKAPTVRHALAHLEAVEAGKGIPYDPYHKGPDHTERILDRIRKTPADGGDRRSLAAEDQLECHINVDGGKTPGFTDVYGRLRWDTPSVTITAKSSTPSCGRFLHPEQHRNITVREAAILQGFPQSYEFMGSMVSQYRQIGEAVPPLFAQFVAWRILDHLRPRPNVTINFRPVVRQEQPVKGTVSRQLRVVDGFSGSGGLSLGFEAAGFENALAFDTNADAIATFRRNISHRAIVAGVEDRELGPQVSDAIAGTDFVVVGGPPCQGFSQQRRGNDTDPRNNLVLRYADFIENLAEQPAAVVLENVTYLDSPRGKKILAEYISRQRKNGYRTFRHDMNSADYQVPQLRRRIIVVSVREDFADNYQGPVALTPNRWDTVGEALSSLPDFGRAEALFQHSNHEPSNEGDLNKRRIAFVDMGQGRLSVPDFLQLDCHRGYDGHLDVFGRLDWFAPARTITGGFDSFTRGEYGHPFFHRSITPREAARLQGFPDWFEFSGNRASVRKQIGNAVPPPMAYAIAKAVQDAVTVPERATSAPAVCLV